LSGDGDGCFNIQYPTPKSNNQVNDKRRQYPMSKSNNQVNGNGDGNGERINIQAPSPLP